MQKLSAKLRDVDFRQVTQKRTEKMNADLNWACMDLDIAKVNFARAFKDSILDVGTHEREYNPSAFHKYRH